MQEEKLLTVDSLNIGDQVFIKTDHYYYFKKQLEKTTSEKYFFDIYKSSLFTVIFKTETTVIIQSDMCPLQISCYPMRLSKRQGSQGSYKDIIISKINYIYEKQRSAGIKYV